MTDQKRDSMSSSKEIIDSLADEVQKECEIEDTSEYNAHLSSDENQLHYSDSDEEKNKEPSLPDDFVDEEALKKFESTLSKEDLEKRRVESKTMKIKGNEAFKNENFMEAVKIYTDALHICPLANFDERAILYCNRAAAKIKLCDKQNAIEDCSKALLLDSNYIRAYMRRAKLYEDTEKLDESLEDYKKVLELDPSHKEAQIAALRLPPLIKERNERLKTEMLGK